MLDTEATNTHLEYVVFTALPLHDWLLNMVIINFDVLLTVHLSIFILVFNQLDAQNLFYNKFYHHIYRCDDTRGCVMQF